MEFCDTPFTGDGAISSLRREGAYLVAMGRIRKNGRDVSGVARCRADAETVPLRRQILQQSYYLGRPAAAAAGAALGRPGRGPAHQAHHPACCSPAAAPPIATPCSGMSTMWSRPRRRLCIDASLARWKPRRCWRPRTFRCMWGSLSAPPRCAYCSFVSQSIEKQTGLLEPFPGVAPREIACVGALLADSPFRIRTVYLGGGTPTTLSASQMGRLMDAISSHFDLSRCLEYTVEGGRPDTLDPEKLSVLRRGGADRISINPQTMRDDVLRRMGRRHSAEQALQAYAQAQAAGFRNINMDLIAGLPGDDPAGLPDPCGSAWSCSRPI